MCALTSAMHVSIGLLKSRSFGSVLCKGVILLGNKFMRPGDRLLL